ncbi:RNA polymerase sigma factor [Deinococcus aetherius]|nr:RNA polymerase sigma factor [Deinococcus aetherius]
MEEALLVRLGRGDERALDELYALLSGKVFTLACHMLQSREEAEEVLQDTFLKLHRHAGGYRPEGDSARAFVYAIARNDCLSRLRARRSRPVAGEWDVHDPATPLSAPHTDALHTATVRQALGQLAPPDRELLEGSFFHGYSHPELAERSGLPLGTVKSRLRRALLSLRDYLGDP